MSILRNINYLKELNVQGCSAPDITVAITTGFEAAAPALLSLLTPGCTDIVKLKLGISPWHRKGIRSLIKGIAAPFAAEGNRFLYKIGYFTAERGLYWLMVADVATQFEVTWNSLVFAAQQCPLPSAGTAYGYLAPIIYGAGQNGFLHPSPQHNVTGMAVGLNGVTIFPGFQGTVNWSCEFDSWPERGKGVSVNTWMTEDDSDIKFSEYTTNNPPSQPNNQTIGHRSFDTLRNFTRKDYVFHIENTGDTYAQVLASSYAVQMTGSPSGVVPWGCKFKKTSIPFT